MKVLLAIEMSQRSGSVALRDTQSRVDAEILAPKKRHDDDFMPAIDRLFKRMKLKPEDLQAVAVSIGPGGFTGLRIAISTAKMFAETLRVELVAVPSALVAAQATVQSHNCDAKQDIMVALASKNDSAWCSRIHRDGGHWSIKGESGLCDARSIQLENIAMMLADEHLPLEIRQRCDVEGIRIVPPVFDAQACLSIAANWLDEGRTIDPLQLLPLYARKPEAVALWEKRRARS